MKKIFLCFLASFSQVYALSSYLEIGTGIGYRKDWLSHDAFNASDPDLVAERETFDKISIVQTEVFVKALYKTLYFEGDASFGWFWKGRTRLDALVPLILVPDGIDSIENVDFITKGEVSSYNGAGGLYFKLYKSSWEIGITPIGGYQYDYQKFKRKYPPSPQTIAFSVPLGIETYDPDLSIVDFKRTWKGPLAGGIVVIKPVDSFQIDLGFSYHWLKFIETTGVSYLIQIYNNAGTLLAAATRSATPRISSEKTSGYSGRIRLAYLPTPNWSLALNGKLLYYYLRQSTFPSPNVLEFLQPPIPPTRTIVPGLLSGNWTSFSICVEGSYRF